MIAAAARGIYFSAVMLLFGDLAFCALVRVRLPTIAPPASRFVRGSALALAALAGTVWLAAAATQMAGVLDRQAMVQTITATLFGQLFLARMTALLGLALALRLGARLAPLLAAIALALPAATSHAAAASPAGFAVIGTIPDAVHLLTAGFWIGGLAALAALFARKEPNILPALALFSEWALIAVLLLAMTGLINATSILLAGGDAQSPVYLAVLGTKLVLVAAMLALAAVNRFRLMPNGQDGAIARNAKVELGLGLIVVLLAGALGQLQPVL